MKLSDHAIRNITLIFIVAAFSVIGIGQVNKLVVSSVTSAPIFGSIALGSNASSTGTVRLNKSGSVKIRNEANSADLNVLSKDAANITYLGDSAGSYTRKLYAGGSGVVEDYGGGVIFNPTDYVRIWQSGNASFGELRFGFNFSNDVKVRGQNGGAYEVYTNGAVRQSIAQSGVSTFQAVGLTNVAVTATSGGTTTLDLSTGNVRSIQMPAGNTTIAFSNITAGLFDFIVKQDAVGSRTITWPSTAKDGTATVTTQPTTTANSVTVFSFVSDGTNLQLKSVR